jgi:hypothetical protein
MTIPLSSNDEDDEDEEDDDDRNLLEFREVSSTPALAFV